MGQRQGDARSGLGDAVPKIGVLSLGLGQLKAEPMVFLDQAPGVADQSGEPCFKERQFFVHPSMVGRAALGVKRDESRARLFRYD